MRPEEGVDGRFVPFTAGLDGLRDAKRTSFHRDRDVQMMTAEFVMPFHFEVDLPAQRNLQGSGARLAEFESGEFDGIDRPEQTEAGIQFRRVGEWSATGKFAPVSYRRVEPAKPKGRFDGFFPDFKGGESDLEAENDMGIDPVLGIVDHPLR